MDEKRICMTIERYKQLINENELLKETINILKEDIERLALDIDALNQIYEKETNQEIEEL